MIRLNGKDSLSFELQEVQTLLPPDIGGMDKEIDPQIAHISQLYYWTRSATPRQPVFFDLSAEKKDHQSLGYRERLKVQF